jgi:hypothetical protein
VRHISKGVQDFEGEYVRTVLVMYAFERVDSCKTTLSFIGASSQCSAHGERQVRWWTYINAFREREEKRRDELSKEVQVLVVST